MINFALILSALFLTATSAINPIPSLLDDAFEDIADPACLEHENHLYIYPTASQTDFSCWSAPLPESRGPDFDPSSLKFEKTADPVLQPEKSCLLTKLIPGLGKGTLTWAPHVHYNKKDSMFYMYYSTCLNLYVASSSSPIGPFENPVFLKYLAIDPMLFEDDNGDLVLYYADINIIRIWVGEESIYAVPMSSPTTFAEDATHTQVIKPDQHKWEFFRSSLVAPRGINEGAWVFKDDAGVYYLMYSGAGADTLHYNIGVATSTNALGPFEKYSEDVNPITLPHDPSTVGVFGPGHHSVWRDSVTGKLWAFYHQKGSEENGWDRSVCVDELVFSESGKLTLAVSRG
ncbi:hypothetical protein TL16_g11603 [Triparma laevis f. inornata]|uniref:Arabinanase/levansucrase/invertase n=2 Tax=Triparma laevis TaxID=1534972 RepID=A0A9W7AV30_9STRA|nr:hypothetical protein TrLO_g15843 [Triparma laevis f. longispina]GMH89908.1 hypothetical protein TL16_g11603 [Triparma laevis f. inornata]